MRKAILAVLVIAVALSLAGCEPTAPIPTPSPSAIVGTWHHGADTLRINADGTFSLNKVPLGVIEQAAVSSGAAPAGPNESATGTWVIGSGGTDVGGAPGVQLDFVTPNRVGPDYGLTLVVSGDSPPQLYVFLGRPDSGIKYSFTRS
jgi:hypothetical protein